METLWILENISSRSILYWISRRRSRVVSIVKVKVDTVLAVNIASRTRCRPQPDDGRPHVQDILFNGQGCRGIKVWPGSLLLHAQANESSDESGGTHEVPASEAAQVNL